MAASGQPPDSRCAHQLDKGRDGMHELEISFKMPKNLGEFILAIQRKELALGDYFDCDRMQVDFPHFMVPVIRKMKMASKKNSSKPFFNAPKPLPGAQPLNFAGVQGVNIPGAFLLPAQPMPVAPPKHHPKHAQGPRGQGRTNFNTVEELIKGKDQFLALDEEGRGAVLRRLLLAKLQSHEGLVDV